MKDRAYIMMNLKIIKSIFENSFRNFNIKNRIDNATNLKLIILVVIYCGYTCIMKEHGRRGRTTVKTGSGSLSRSINKRVHCI